eukprot:118335_1
MMDQRRDRKPLNFNRIYDQSLGIEWHCNGCNNMIITVVLRTRIGSDYNANWRIDEVMYSAYGSSSLTCNVGVNLGRWMELAMCIWWNILDRLKEQVVMLVTMALERGERIG